MYNVSIQLQRVSTVVYSIQMNKVNLMINNDKM